MSCPVPQSHGLSPGFSCIPPSSVLPNPSVSSCPTVLWDELDCLWDFNMSYIMCPIYRYTSRMQSRPVLQSHGLSQKFSIVQPSSTPYFFDQTPWLLFFSLFILVEVGYCWGQLLFEVAFILFGSQQITMMVVRAILLGLIDAGSSTHSLSVLLSTVKRSLRAQTAL